LLVVNYVGIKELHSSSQYGDHDLSNIIIIPAQAEIHVSKWHCTNSEMDPRLRGDDSTGLEAILV